MTFVDSDHEIEARCGVEIAYVFEKEGEQGFRRREHQVIEDLTAQRGLVLATGGGAILSAENRSALACRGFVVYLQASIAQQLERTERTDNRPLLQGVDRRATLEELLRLRDPLYREIADLVVLTDGRNARTLAREIEEHFARASVSS